jgi:hypothetical protein
MEVIIVKKQGDVNTAHCLKTNLAEKGVCLKTKNLAQNAYPKEGSESEMGLTMREKKALTREVSKRYQKAEKKEKTKILDELVKNTGYNRKYILHVLANWGKTTTVRLAGEAGKYWLLSSAPR